MTPSVGRIVHVTASNGGCYAAIITSIETLFMTVTVFYPRETACLTVPLQENAGELSWHWPERI